ncbi:MAG TPA: cupin domain-containing protein [Candidatus Binatia bacterium]|nr:cupin domain-containing protein [Candidatus Binatia bacterium]
MKTATALLACLFVLCAPAAFAEPPPALSSPFATVIAVPDDARTLLVMSDTVRLLVSGAQTGGAYAVAEIVSPAGSGPPPHVHADEDEIFYVLEGSVELFDGEKRSIVGPGSVAVLPRGRVHGYRNAGTTPLRMLLVLAPARFAQYFEALDKLGKDATPQRATELGRDFHLQFMPPPQAPR